MTDTTQVHTVVGTNDLITVPPQVPGSIFSARVYPHSFFGKVGEMRWVNVSIYTQNVSITENTGNATRIWLDLELVGTGQKVDIAIHSDQFEVPEEQRQKSFDLTRLIDFIQIRLQVECKVIKIVSEIEQICQIPDEIVRVNIFKTCFSDFFFTQAAFSSIPNSQRLIHARFEKCHCCSSPRLKLVIFGNMT